MSEVKKHKHVLVPEKQLLVVSSRFKDSLPHGAKFKTFNHNGKELLKVKHNVQNTIALNKAGFEIDSPILHYYNFPPAEGKYPPRPHQVTSCAFHTLNKKSFNLSEPRTGKTLTCLWTYDYLKSQSLVDKLIIFTTLSTVSSVWAKAVFNTVSHLTPSAVMGTPEKKREALSLDVDIYILNHDSCKSLENEIKSLLKKHPKTMIVWDEADNLTNASTAMWKSFRKQFEMVPYGILATGTPTGENRPTDAWALAKLVNPDNVPKYFGRFREETMYQITQYKWVPRKGANEAVFKALQPAICFKKDDVLDLKKPNFINLPVDLTEEQTKMFKTMKQDMVSEYEGEVITAIQASDKLTKLLQILLGSYKVEENEYRTIPCEPRVQAIVDLIKSTPNKAVVFSPFKGALRYYYKEISKHFSCAYVDGDVTGKKRNDIFHDFEEYDHPHVLFAHPKTTAHGLELARADKIIWNGPPHSGRQYLQACERINSSKQKNEMYTYHIGAHKIEWDIYDKLTSKKFNQKELLEMYKALLTEVQND